VELRTAGGPDGSVGVRRGAGRVGGRRSRGAGIATTRPPIRTPPSYGGGADRPWEMPNERFSARGVAVPPGSRRPPGPFELEMTTRIVVRIAIVATVVVVTLAAAHHSVETTAALTSPKSELASTIDQEQLSCLEAAFGHAVPRGARVYIGAVDTSSLQYLSLIVTRSARLTADSNAAQWVVAIEPGNQCLGLRLSVVRRR